jgi:hypothetical protein
MSRQLKVFLAVLSTLVLLLASVLTAVAGGPQWQSPVDGVGMSAAGANIPEQAKCTKMEISDPALWFATDKDGNVYSDKVVDQYPTGASYIAAGFEYNCILKNTTVTVVYYYGGFDTEPVFTDSSKESPDSKGGTYWWYIGYDDGTTLPEGDWQVEWYINEELASSGEITVGGGTKDDIKDIQPTPEPTEETDGTDTTDINDIWNFGDETPTPTPDTVSVQGTIVDGKTKKPIAGALFVVLNPGVAAQDWVDNKFPAEDVYCGADTDTKGQFVCQQQLERNVTYTVFVVAKGYQPIVAEDFLIDEQQEDPVDLTIKMYK